jgi:hypothetical protein
MSPAPRPRDGRCHGCGGGLRHELLTLEAHLLGAAWVVCPPCAAALLERFRRSHAEAERILDEIWDLPPRELGSW